MDAAPQVLLEVYLCRFFDPIFISLALLNRAGLDFNPSPKIRIKFT